MDCHSSFVVAAPGDSRGWLSVRPGPGSASCLSHCEVLGQVNSSLKPRFSRVPDGENTIRCRGHLGDETSVWPYSLLSLPPLLCFLCSQCAPQTSHRCCRELVGGRGRDPSSAESHTRALGSAGSPRDSEDINMAELSLLNLCILISAQPCYVTKKGFPSPSGHIRVSLFCPQHI